MTRAQQEARSSSSGAVQTEHELLALLGVRDGTVAEVFSELGITVDPVRALVVERMGPGSEQPTQGQLPFSPLAKKVLEVALREALSLGSQHIGAEHLLLGIVRTDCGACQILQTLGADPESVRREVQKRVPGPVPGRPVNVARLLPRGFRRGQVPEADVSAPLVEFLSTADPALRHLLMVSAGLALTEGRQLFGVNDLLGALARDDEVARLLAELGLDPKMLRERFGEEPPAAGAAPAV